MKEMAVVTRCPHCTQVLPEGAKFCGGCGSSLPGGGTVEPEPVTVHGGDLKQTMIQYPVPPAPAPPSAPLAPGSATRVDPHKTMLGYALPADAIPASRRGPNPVGPGFKDTLVDEHGPLSRPDPLRRNQPMQTILGVAMPGIAPTGASVPRPTPQRREGLGQTQIGGPAIPFSAPPAAYTPPSPPPPPPPSPAPLSRRHAGAPGPGAAPVRIVPRPPPLVEEPLPAPPRLPRKRGVPMAVVAGSIAVLVVLAGVLLLTLSHGTPPVTGEPRTGPDGAELLHVSCPTCEPGSAVALENVPPTTAHPAGSPAMAKVNLVKGEADLPLATALHIGSNTFSVALSRPNAREDTVTLDVPVTYRITPDLSRLSARPPQLALRVEALVGSDVNVDGTKVTLDGAGHGSAPVIIAPDVEGTSDEMTLIQRKLAYTVKLPHGPVETGSLALRVGVAQLHLEAPGRTPVTSNPTITVAGVVAKTAEVWLGDTQLAVGTDGRFAQTVPVVMGMTPLVLYVEQGATVATRTMHIAVQRVPDVQAEAAARDAASPLGYDALVAALDSSIGQSVALEGPIVEARQVGRGTILLVDDRRGCAKSPCLTRVLHGDIADPPQGTVVRVYGKVTRSFRTASGAVVPEVEADFLLPRTATSPGAHAGLLRSKDDLGSAPDTRY